MPWLLCDYGEVLSLPQDPGALAKLAALTGREERGFSAAYWRHRLPYDLGNVVAATYWDAVLGTPVDPELLAALVALDVASWTRPNPAVLAAIDAVRATGVQTAVLSNAPADIARALDGAPWMAGFAPRLFSCDLRLAKPDIAVFAGALAILDAAAADVVFIDDRDENVAAARAAGLDARLYRGPEVFALLATERAVGPTKRRAEPSPQ